MDLCGLGVWFRCLGGLVVTSGFLVSCGLLCFKFLVLMVCAFGCGLLLDGWRGFGFPRWVAFWGCCIIDFGDFGCFGLLVLLEVSGWWVLPLASVVCWMVCA